MLFHFRYFVVKCFIRFDEHLIRYFRHILVHITSDREWCFQQRPVHGRACYIRGFFDRGDRWISWLGLKDVILVWIFREGLNGLGGGELVNISLWQGGWHVRLHLLIMRGEWFKRTNTLTCSKLTRYFYKCTCVLLERSVLDEGEGRLRSWMK